MMEENKPLLEEYFGKQIQEYIAGNPEKAKELILRLRTFLATEEWKVLKKVIEDTRERVIQNMSICPVEMGTLLAYRESITALDFLRNLPENLIKVLELQITEEK